MKLSIHTPEPAAEFSFNKLIFTGPRRDVPNVLAAFDCYINPTLREGGVPIAMMEAMASNVAPLRYICINCDVRKGGYLRRLMFV